MTKSTLSDGAVKSLVYGMHGAPYDILGRHPHGKDAVVFRTWQPFGEKVEILFGAEARSMERTHKDGLFELVVPAVEGALPYRYRITDGTGHSWEFEDPYRFPLQITDFDLYLFGEGTHFRTYEKMGAHLLTVEGMEGVHFAVWAPNALRVSVTGEFNRWNGLNHPLQKRADSGLWELFIPGLKQGDLYKYEIKGPRDYLGLKADPYGFASELRPKTASMVWDIHNYKWDDQEWMEKRASGGMRLDQPVSVYEVHLGSWRRVPTEDNRWLTYREMAEWLVPYVKKLGFTHVELLPVSEHPFDGSWGYQTIGYYAPTARFGTPDDFKYFVDCCHKEGIGVLLDWVPAHFPKDSPGLAYFDGTHLYEHSDPRLGEHRDWGTLIFNYGRNEVRSFLLSNAVYWADVYHIDGLRVDAVASMLYLDYSRKHGEWIPNKFGGRENLEAVEFIKKFSEIVHAEYPGFLTFAEESTAWPMVSRPTYLGGLGFGFKWNMGWMNDILTYFSKDPVYRKYHHHNVTFSLIYAFTENFILPFSHDEVVHGKGSMMAKMPGDTWRKFANMRLLLAFMYAHPGKKLLFMGIEIGQWNEWNSTSSLDWHLLEGEPHQKLQNLVRDLNLLYKAAPPLHEVDFSWEGFEWIDLHDAESSIIAFMRKAKDARDVVLCVCNFTPVVREQYRLGVPFQGVYEQVLNTDAAEYGGSNTARMVEAASEPMPWHAREHSVLIPVPPLGAVFYRVRRPPPAPVIEAVVVEPAAAAMSKPVVATSAAVVKTAEPEAEAT